MCYVSGTLGRPGRFLSSIPRSLFGFILKPAASENMVCIPREKTAHGHEILGRPPLSVRAKKGARSQSMDAHRHAFDGRRDGGLRMSRPPSTSDGRPQKRTAVTARGLPRGSWRRAFRFTVGAVSARGRWHRMPTLAEVRLNQLRQCSACPQAWHCPRQPARRPSSFDAAGSRRTARRRFCISGTGPSLLPSRP